MAIVATAILVSTVSIGIILSNIDQNHVSNTTSVHLISASASYSHNVLKLDNTNGSTIVTFNINGYQAVYTVNGVSTYISLYYLANGSVEYSINNGSYATFDPHSLTSGQGSSSAAVHPAVTYTTDSSEWFDGIYFDYGYPHVYSHPDLPYYGIYAKYNAVLWGNQLLHYMFGWGYIDSLGPLGTAAIGAAIGDEAGSFWGAIGGAVIGAILGAVLPTILKDNAQDIWRWINSGLISALAHAPWWAYLPGGQQYYFYENFHYLRLGGTTLYNQMGITFP